MIARLLLLLLALVTAVPAAAESQPPIFPEGEVVGNVPAVLARFKSGDIMTVAWSPDGRRIAAGSGDGTVRLWDTESGRELRRLEGHAGDVNSVAWSPDGRRLASASEDTTVRLWDAESGGELRRLEGHGDWVLSVAWSPDGRRLASASADKTVRLWDAESGRELRRLEGHDDRVWSVAWSPDGRRLASASTDTTVRLWDAESGRELRRLEGHSRWVGSVAWSPDGRRLTSAAFDQTLRLWDAESGRELRRLEKLGPWIQSVAWSPDGSRFASASGEQTVQLWDAESGREVRRLEGHGSAAWSVAWSPDGRRLASASADQTVRLWDAKSGRELQRLEGHRGEVNSVAWSPDGHRLASASDDQTVRLWDSESGRELRRLEGHGGMVLSVAWSPDGSRLASVSAGQTIWLWDAGSGRELRRMKGHGSVAWSVAWSPDGRRLATGSNDGTVLLWDTESGRELRRLEGHGGSVLSVAWSREGSRLASASADKTVRLWDAESGRELRRLEGHGADVSSVVWSPDGRRLTSASDDGTVRLWNAQTGQPEWGLAGGLGGRWLACRFADSRCWRYDDGSLLPLPRPEPPARLEAAVEAAAGLTLTVAAPASLPVRVRNMGPSPAYGVTVVARMAGVEVPVAVLPVRPEPVFRLGAGEGATLDLGLFGAAAYQAPAEGPARLDLALVHAHGEQPIGSLPVTVVTPRLELAAAEATADPPALALTVRNDGHADAADLAASAVLTGPGLDRPLPLDEITRKGGIRAGETTTLVLALPLGLRLSPETRVDLTLLSTAPPLHRWSLTAPIVPPGLSLAEYAAFAATVLLLSASAYWALVWRHPLVAGPRRRPEALFEVPPEQLHGLGRRLDWAFLRRTVLARAGVPEPRFERAAGFAALPARARLDRLVERLNLRLETAEPPVLSDGVQLFAATTPEEFPLNLPRLRLVLPPAGLPRAEVLDALGRDEDGKGIVAVILAADPEQRQALASPALPPDARVAVLSGADLTTLLLVDDPSAAFARCIAGQLKVTLLSPYQQGGGVHASAGFFGRASELAHILSRDPANYFVIGGRQIGKSSLLKALLRRCSRLPATDAHYCVLDGPDPRAPLAAALGLDPAAPLDSVLAALPATPGRRRLVLIDEADALVSSDRQGGFPVLSAFRRLSEEGRVFFVLAGFWALQRAIAFEHKTPLRNFGEALPLGPLDPEAARELAVRPMAALALRYASDDLPERIRQRTGGRANLISLACADIVEGLGTGQRVIDAATVKRALASDAVRNALGGWVELSGAEAEAANRLDRILVYATIGDDDGFTLSDLQRRLHAMGAPFPPEAIRESLARLSLAYILHRDEGSRYRYPVPLFIDFVRENDLPLVLGRELEIAREAKG